MLCTRFGTCSTTSDEWTKGCLLGLERGDVNGSHSNTYSAYRCGLNLMEDDTEAINRYVF